MARNSDSARSILLQSDDDRDELEERDELQLREAEEREKKVSYWHISEKTRAHATQMIMMLGANLGTHLGDSFKIGVYAKENLNGLREYISHKDDKESRDMLVFIGSIRLVPTYIVPLFMASADDPDMLVPLLKLFLALTRAPTSEKRESIMKRVREKPYNKEEKEDCAKRVKKAKDFQKNAYEQMEALSSFKEAIVSLRAMEIIYNYFDESATKAPEDRTAEDLKRIETILFLICNLLQIRAGAISSSKEQIDSRSLQNKLILYMEESGLLDCLLSLCFSIQAQGSSQWNGLITEIFHYLVWDRDMKDVVYFSRNQNVSSMDLLVKQYKQSRSADKGKLSSQVNTERNKRRTCLQNPVDQRMNNLGGMIKATVGGTAARTNSLTSGNDKKPNKSSASVLLRGVTGQAAINKNGTVASQINSSILGGRGKKKGRKCTFAASASSGTMMQSVNNAGNTGASGSSVNVLQATMKSNMTGGLGDEEKNVSVVLANFLKDFLGTPFSELALSMKKSWQRADAGSPYHDLLFYQLVTACLQFAKYYCLDEHKSYISEKEKGISVEPWIPDLKNVVVCFDVMMIKHQTDSIRAHFEIAKGLQKPKVPGDLFYSMLLYKETVSFLRIMIESQNMAHNDVAMHTVYLLYCNPVASECLDVLPVLLRNWNSRFYTKSHLVCLIELCHETLKLLDFVDLHVISQEGNRKKLSKKAVKSLEEQELHTAAARNFDKEEYFQRITSPVTVALYTKALELYRENTPQLNHYIYVYLKRMKEHLIETDDYSDNNEDSNDEDKGLTEAERMKRRESQKLSLGYLLFNIGTLNTFNVILNDHENNKTIEQLLQLIKCMVRKFGDLADKNHLLYVEILLHQSFPIRVMADIFSTYQAAHLAKNYRTTGRVPIKNKSGSKGGKRHVLSENAIVYSSESEANSDEFSRLSRPVAKPVKGKKRKSDLRNRIEKNRNNRKKSSRDEDTSDDDNISDDELANLQTNLPAPKSRSRTSRFQWTSGEDEALRRLYKLYAGSRSVFTMIAQDEDFVQLGGKKNAEKIEKRVQQLQLHLELADMASSDEENDDVSSSDTSDAKSSEASDVENKKRKRTSGKKKSSKDRSKKQKLKSKSSIFLRPGVEDSNAQIDNDESKNQMHSGDDISDVENKNDDSEGDALRSPWPLRSPVDVYSKDGSTEKPFWEDDLDDENGFDQRMLALATKNLGSGNGATNTDLTTTLPVAKKKNLLKKNGPSNLSDDSESDIDVEGDDQDVESRGFNQVARHSILADSDDE